MTEDFSTSSVDPIVPDDSYRLASRETAVIRRVRLLLVGVLLASAGAAAGAAYASMREAEIEKSRVRFHNLADKIIQELHGSVSQMVGAVDMFRLNVASVADNQWPFVIVPDFAERADKLMKLHNVIHVSIQPYISGDQMEAWNNFSLANDEWVEEAFAYQDLGGHVKNNLLRGIHSMFGNLTSGPYVPMWQNYPLWDAISPYNWDVLGFEIDQYGRVINGGPCIMSRSNVVTEAPNRIIDGRAIWLDALLPEGENGKEPSTAVFCPIQEHSTTSSILSVAFFWRHFVENILPEGSGSIDVVFNSSCAPTFTYRVAGPEAIYLGPGDLHDRDFSSMGIPHDLLKPDEHTAHGGGSMSHEHASHVHHLDTEYMHHESKALDTNYCPVSVMVYPTPDMHIGVSNGDPLTFSLLILVVFVVTSIAFALYDSCVERRQRIVLLSAVTSVTKEATLEERVQRRSRRLEEANRFLEEANRKVVQASEAQLKHFACMSHEIRTPLNCINGCASLLRDCDLNPSQKESVLMISESGDLLLSVINDVLDFSRLETGNVIIESRRSDTQATLSTAINSISKAAQGKEILVVTDYAMDVPDFAEFDGRRLEQILMKLLGNAIKFNKTGGTLRLGVSFLSDFEDFDNTSYFSPHRDDESEVGASIGPYLLFSVQDQGKGIETDDFESIFHPFILDTSSLGSTRGTGLGLSIVKHLVRKLGGEIFLKSSLEEGSEFLFYLPINRIPSDEEASAVTTGKLRQKSIAVVTQSTDILNYFKLVQKAFDLKLSFFEHLEDATACKYDAYVVDEELFVKDNWKQPGRLITMGPKGLNNTVDAHIQNIRALIPRSLMKELLKQEKRQRPHSVSPSMSRKVVIPYKELRVLIAEDNIINQKVLNRILNRLGIENVEIVGNGQQAIQMAASRPFDFILMDMQMPVMDGLEACKKIREREDVSHPKPTIIFVSAHAIRDFEDQCYEAGGYDFVSKPCSVRSIDQCFQRIYEKDATLFDSSKS